jgi:hypothetical protein
MEFVIRHLSRLCVALMLVSGLSLAQGTKTATPSANAKSNSKQNSATPEQEQMQVMRKEHLRNLRIYILARTVDSLKKVDEPALRISARNELLKYLTLDNSSSDEDKALVTNLALDDLADFNDHSDEIMPSLAEYLFSNLGAWIKKYQSNLREKFEAVKNSKMGAEGSQSIRALLELPSGDTLAAQRITQDLEAGQDIPVLVLYLNELIRRKSKEVEPLLSKIVDIAAQGELSFDTLFSISDLYWQPQMSVTLKQRFVAMVIARTQPSNFGSGTVPSSAYDLLTNVLPVAQQLSPELYSQAVNQRLVLYASLNKAQIASEERSKRLNDSLSGIDDMVAEAEEVKSKEQRNELLAEAVQLALEKKRFDLCLNILAKLDLDATDATLDSWRNWNDQFVKELVQTALIEKRPELAEKGAGDAVTSFGKVQALVMIMRYLGKANDKRAAQRLLAEATKVAGDAPDYVEKTKAFLLLSATSNQADGSQETELLESAIRALNDMSMPDRNAEDKKPYQRYVWKLNGTEYEVIGSFRDSTKRNEDRALAQVEKIAKPESRTFALIGVLQGVGELSLVQMK